MLLEILSAAELAVAEIALPSMSIVRSVAHNKSRGGESVRIIAPATSSKETVRVRNDIISVVLDGEPVDLVPVHARDTCALFEVEHHGGQGDERHATPSPGAHYVTFTVRGSSHVLCRKRGVSKRDVKWSMERPGRQR